MVQWQQASSFCCQQFLVFLCIGLTLAFVFSAADSLPIGGPPPMNELVGKMREMLSSPAKTNGASDSEVVNDEQNTNGMNDTRSLYQLHDYNSRDWVTDDLCHRPIDPIISETRDLFDPRNVKNSTARILNVGMPKSGSSSVSKLFQNSGFHVSHQWGCGEEGLCGNCFSRHLNTSGDIFQQCGNFNVFGQMDQQVSGCIYPQIELLDKLYEDAPHATWLMPLRNVSEWLDSINRWNDLRDRFGICNFRPHLDFEGGNQGDEKNDQKMMALYCNHVQQIRQFIVDHPTLSLVEFRIEDPNIGSFLASYFPVDPAHWGHHNANKKIKKNGL